MIVNEDSKVVTKLETLLSDNARVVIYDRHMLQYRPLSIIINFVQPPHFVEGTMFTIDKYFIFLLRSVKTEKMFRFTNHEPKLFSNFQGLFLPLGNNSMTFFYRYSTNQLPIFIIPFAKLATHGFMVGGQGQNFGTTAFSLTTLCLTAFSTTPDLKKDEH